MQINNILDLIKIVNTGQSVISNRVDIWNVDGKDVERLTKVWQLEKVNEHEYCYKDFDGWNRGIKHFFFIDSSKADRPISEYFDNFKKAFCNVMSHVYGDEEMILKEVSQDLLNYKGWTLSYTNKELLEDRQTNRLYIYKFTSFKTKQTLG